MIMIVMITIKLIIETTAMPIIKNCNGTTTNNDNDSDNDRENNKAKHNKSVNDKVYENRKMKKKNHNEIMSFFISAIS